MLDEAIHGNGEADEDEGRDETVELSLGAEPLKHQKKDDDICQRGVGALQALVGAHEADPRRDRKDGANEVNQHQE